MPDSGRTPSSGARPSSSAVSASVTWSSPVQHAASPTGRTPCTVRPRLLLRPRRLHPGDRRPAPRPSTSPAARPHHPAPAFGQPRHRQPGLEQRLLARAHHPRQPPRLPAPPTGAGCRCTRRLAGRRPGRSPRPPAGAVASMTSSPIRHPPSYDPTHPRLDGSTSPANPASAASTCRNSPPAAGRYTASTWSTLTISRTSRMPAASGGPSRTHGTADSPIAGTARPAAFARSQPSTSRRKPFATSVSASR